MVSILPFPDGKKCGKASWYAGTAGRSSVKVSLPITLTAGCEGKH